MTKKPSYRFAGFEDEWKEVKLGEVGETYTGLSGKTKEDFGHGEGKFITYVNVFNNPLTDLYELDSVEVDDKQRRVQYGDVLFTTSSETPEDVGLSSVWMGTEDNVYLNSFCFGYRPQKGIFDLYYLAFVLRSFSVRREFMLLAQGISRFNISKTKVMDMSIHVPSLPEQTAIGSFFQDIDQLINLQQRKLEVLKEQKKTYLKLLFPAKGQTKPALRFAGFEDEWKEVKLGEIGETYTGLSGKTKEDFGHGEGKFITYVNVFNNPLTDLYGLDSVEIDDKQRRVQYGDVLFTTSSETPEDVGLSSVWMGTEDNVYLNSFCFGYRPQKGIFDLYYLAFVLRSFSVRREFMLLAQGISRFNISKTKVMDMAIHVPSLPEQEAIGSFFQDLDKAIAKQEEKVNQLKESKQTLLRKMFI